MKKKYFEYFYFISNVYISPLQQTIPIVPDIENSVYFYLTEKSNKQFFVFPLGIAVT